MFPQTYWYLLQKKWKRPILLFKGEGGGVGDSKEGAPREALTTPRGHYGTTLGMPRTHGRDSSMHTWAPQHVWCALHGRNGTGPGTTYPLPAQARGCPKPCAVSQLRKPWAQCHGLMRHQTTVDSHHDAYAQHKDAMPYAPRGISHGRNAMARCYGVGPDGGSKQHIQAMGT